MQLSDATHDYACTRCGTTQGTCMEALWLASRLASSIEARAQHLPEDFEILSTTRFTGCGRDCAVQLRVTAAFVKVSSGTQGARVEAIPQGRALAAKSGS